MTGNFVPIIITGPESWRSLGILNPNAFLSDQRADIVTCADKLALSDFSIQVIRKQIYIDRERFIKELKGKVFKEFVPNPQKPIVIIYHNVSFQAGLQSFFVTIKSMLDIYAKIISTSISPGTNLFGFNKGTFRGKKMVGGRLLNWIECSTPASYADKDKLIEILTGHIDNWIIDVVKHRDEIVHYGMLNGLIEMCVPLSKKAQNIRKEEIILPKIQGKGNVLEYCQNIQQEINQLLRETLVLLPNINIDLIEL